MPTEGSWAKGERCKLLFHAGVVSHIALYYADRRRPLFDGCGLLFSVSRRRPHAENVDTVIALLASDLVMCGHSTMYRASAPFLFVAVACFLVARNPLTRYRCIRSCACKVRVGMTTTAHLFSRRLLCHFFNFGLNRNRMQSV